MAVFDKVLEFFGLKSGSVEVKPSAGPIHEDPTHRGQLRPPSGSHSPDAAAPHPPSSHSVAAPPAGRAAGSASTGQPTQDAALERERRERAQLEARLRRLEEEKLQLQQAQRESSRSSDADRPVGQAPSPSFDSVTGGEPRSPRGAPPPEDDRTRNPNLKARDPGKVPTGVIVAIAGPNLGLVRALGPGQNLIGRHTPNTQIAVPLRDEEQIISRQHCEIECTGEGERFTITPLENSIGELARTIVNDHPLERKTVLRDGATIRVFENVLRFRTLEGGS